MSFYGENIWNVMVCLIQPVSSRWILISGKPQYWGSFSLIKLTNQNNLKQCFRGSRITLGIELYCLKNWKTPILSKRKKKILHLNCVSNLDDFFLYVYQSDIYFFISFIRYVLSTPFYLFLKVSFYKGVGHWSQGFTFIISLMC